MTRRSGPRRFASRPRSRRSTRSTDGVGSPPARSAAGEDALEVVAASRTNVDEQRQASRRCRAPRAVVAGRTRSRVPLRTGATRSPRACHRQCLRRRRRAVPTELGQKRPDPPDLGLGDLQGVAGLHPVPRDGPRPRRVDRAPRRASAVTCTRPRRRRPRGTTPVGGGLGVLDGRHGAHVTRSSPPPTSEPRAMRTTPKRPSPARQSATRRPVAGLEDVQGQPGVGEEHRRQGEHAERPVGHRSRMPGRAPAASGLDQPCRRLSPPLRRCVAGRAGIGSGL